MSEGTTTRREGVYVGVDGGGTGTTLIVGDATGRILSVQRGGPGNMQSSPWERVRHEWDALLTAGLLESGASEADVACMAMGMAGADRVDDKELVRGWLRTRLPEETTVRLFNDAQTALAAGTQRAPGRGADRGHRLHLLRL